MRVVTIVVAAVLVAATYAHADVVVPSANELAEGNTDNGIPFNTGLLFGVTSVRHQQVYGAAEFPTGSLLLTGVWFRPDIGNAGSAFGPTNIPNVTIQLSTTSMAVDGLSTTFSDNIGADVTTVHSGTLTLSSADTGPGPRDFDIFIPFGAPFVYNPASGNLLMDVRNPSNVITTQLDAHVGADSVSRLIALDVSSATGSTDSLGLITKFQFRQVPEPAALSLLAVAAMALAVGRRRRTS